MYEVLALNVEKLTISCCETVSPLHQLICVRIEIKLPSLKRKTDGADMRELLLFLILIIIIIINVMTTATPQFL
jgi:hypothetical protein